MLTLDLAIATHRPEGILRVARMLLPPIDGINYIISWQAHENAPVPPELESRSDLKIFRYGQNGLSNNRNNAISHCTGDIIVFSDDDVLLYPDGLRKLRICFEENPQADLITFRSIRKNNVFPTSSCILNNGFPKNYSVASFEIGFRRCTAGDLRCCPELGLGSPRFHGGEDEMFVQSAIHRGLDCRYFPITVCAHPQESTGSKKNMTPSNLRAFGCVIALTYPRTSVLRIPIKAWRLWRNGQASFFKSLFYLSSGLIATPGILKRNHDTLW